MSDCSRCQAATKSGSRCKLKTCRQFPYCWIHLKSKENLQVKDSKIAGAGKGLFYVGTKPLAAKKKVTDYSAKQISKTANKDSDYVLEVGKARYLDSEEKQNFVGRYINSNKGTGKPPNVRFSTGTQVYDKANRKTVPIYSTKKLKNGDELLMNYGRSFVI